MKMERYKGFIVRKIRRTDREDLIRNYWKLYDEIRRNPLLGITLFEKKPTMKEETKWFKSLFNEVKKGNAIASVAETDGKVVGVCEIRPSLPRVEQKHIGTLGIVIREEDRARGIGSALIEDVLKRARRRYRIVILHVFGNNDHAQSLYRKFGFREYGRLPKGIIRGNKKIDDVLMYKEIS